MKLECPVCHHKVKGKFLAAHMAEKHQKTLAVSENRLQIAVRDPKSSQPFKLL